MIRNLFIFFIILYAFCSCDVGTDPRSQISRYNIIWDSQSNSSVHSMPVGGGNIGLNAWVENGKLMFYIGSPDAHDEKGNNIKLGRIRISTSPTIFNSEFRQELCLYDGYIRFTGKLPDGTSVEGRLWVEVSRPVIHVQFESGSPVTWQASFESWPAEMPGDPEYNISGPGEVSGEKEYNGSDSGEVPENKEYKESGTVEIPADKEYIESGSGEITGGRESDESRFDKKSGDQAVSVTRITKNSRYHAFFRDYGIEWNYLLDQEKYSRERLQVIVSCGMKGLESQVADPGRNLVLGGRMVSPGMVPSGETQGRYMSTPFQGWKLETGVPCRRLDLTILLRIAQDSRLSDWQQALDSLWDEVRGKERVHFRQTTDWWHGFWDRSHIDIRPSLGREEGEKDSAWLAARNYQLFRYMLGCNSTGQYPTLFNGGFFTADVPVPDARLENLSPDARLWSNCGFMAQNQRLIYWPMLKSCDRDMMRVALDFYRDRAETQQARAERCWGIKGTPFPEPMDWYGLFGDMGDESGHSKPKHLEYHYTSTLDFAYMMIEYARFTGEDISPYLPVIEGIVTWYDRFYRKMNAERTGSELDSAGKLVIYPSCALEFAQGCRNNTDVLAGLDAITEGLLALPPGVLSNDKIVYYKDFRKHIPDFPVGEKDGNKYLDVAESYESRSTHQNMEFPQMYAVFPFQRLGVGLPDIDLVLNTWKYGFTNRSYQDDYICWYQNGIFTARMGMADTAAAYALKKLLHSGDPPRLLYKQWPTPCYPMRFPAFYNTFTFDHPPCMDHGGSAMVGLQEMLMQTPGRQIILFPAWPRDWDVDFKLNAPFETVVEGRYENGKLVDLKITPRQRINDVVDMSLNP